MVENLFRTMKSILDTRPIYHKCDDTIRGHVFCSFLALVLQRELLSRMRSRGGVARPRHCTSMATFTFAAMREQPRRSLSAMRTKS